MEDVGKVKGLLFGPQFPIPGTYTLQLLCIMHRTSFVP